MDISSQLRKRKIMLQLSVVLFVVGLLLTGFPAQAVGEVHPLGYWRLGKSSASPYQNLSCSAPIRIMPAGDSITRGNSSGVSELDQQVGYRRDLWHSLRSAGYQVDFVGSQINGQYYQPIDGFDPQHEGRSGWTDTQVANNIYNWLVANPADVVLLHIGTNQVERSPTDIENILKEIDRYDESVIVVLARIINQITYSQTVRDFNDNVEAMALARIANGDRIIIVDMENGAGLNYSSYTTGGDMWDNLHPYTTGYSKMAQVWLDALRGFLPVCTDSSPIITSDPVTAATVGHPYSYDVEASGNPIPSFALTVAPEGMSINAATGLIVWTPNTAGAFDIIVEASNSAGVTTQSYTVTVNDAGQPPVITSTPITEGGVGLSYSYDVEASGDPAPSFSLIASPAGMSIDAVTGMIAWTPDAAGLFEVTVRATNSAGIQDQSFAISVQDGRQEPMCPADMISYWPMDDVAGSTLFSDIQSGYSGSCSGSACPTTTHGKVAGALSFDGNDKVDVPPQSDFNWSNTDSFSIELWVNTIQSCSGNKVFIGKYGSNSNVAWWVGCNPTGNAYFSVRDSRKTSVGFGGTTRINDGNWHHLVAVYNGSSRQNLLYVNGQLEAFRSSNYAGDFVSNASLSLGYYANGYFYRGILDEVAIYDRALEANEVQQHYAHSAGGNSYCTAPETGQAPAITSEPVTSATVGQLYSYPVEATGNPAPSFALAVAPEGMSIDAATGLLSWTPSTAGAFNVTVEASNSTGTVSQNFVVNVVEASQAPVITSESVTEVTEGQPYSYDVEASGNPTPSFRLSVAPEGMSIDVATGLVSWTPNTAGVFNVTVEASNSVGTISQSFIINVAEALQPPIITSEPVTEATAGQLYSYDVEASGNPISSFALTVAPEGMSINATTGLLSWTPNTAGAFNVTVEASNSAGTVSQSFTITVAEEVTEAPTFFTSPVIAVVGELYQYQAQADGTPPPTYTLAAAPQGMIIDPDTGLLQWTPEIPGLFDVMIVAENSGGAISQSFQIQVVSFTSASVRNLLTANMVLTAFSAAEPHVIGKLWIPLVTSSR